MRFGPESEISQRRSDGLTEEFRSGDGGLSVGGTYGSFLGSYSSTIELHPHNALLTRVYRIVGVAVTM